MVWIISGLMGLFVLWCAYSVGDHFAYHWWWSGRKFKDMSLFNKLLYITYQFVKWTLIITLIGVLFIWMTIGIKIVIFG